jgi:hypothetical protein
VRRRYWWWIAGSGLAVVGLVLVLVWWPRGRDLPPARARVYSDASACLLTDSAGVASSQAAPVWAGMESASLRTRTKVSYLAVAGEDSTANAVPFLNTLVQRQCGLVIAVGANEVGAVRQQASAYPKTRFAVVGPDAGANITALTATSAGALTTNVDDLVAQITSR